MVRVSTTESIDLVISMFKTFATSNIP